MASKVFFSYKPYKKIKKLKKMIVKVFKDLTAQYIFKLSSSTKIRVLAVIDGKGSAKK